MSDELALNGGQPAVPAELTAHNWERYRKSSQEEIDAVVEVLKSGHLSIAAGKGMPNAEGLEREFAEYTGAPYALATSTGTASLHCAVAGVGVEPGDEVIVPAYTFIASAMAILHHNAIPVFADINPDTFCIDPKDVEAKITEKTKAIMAVHIYGLPCDMDEINAIAKRHGLMVIEDAAQAYGPLYKGKKTGSLADAAGFAMTTTKQLMVGEGGVMTAANKEIYDRAALTRLFGERCDMNDINRAYMSDQVGWNYKMAEPLSALARVKLRHLDDYIHATQVNAERLSEQLSDIKGLQTPVIPADRTHSWYLYAPRIKPDELNIDAPVEKVRNALMHALAAENVKVSLWQTVPVPAQPAFKHRMAYGNGCPWRCSDSKVVYDGFDFPNTMGILKDHFVVWGLVPPNPIDVPNCYAEAFHKVFARIDEVVDIYDRTETYTPLEDRMRAV